MNEILLIFIAALLAVIAYLLAEYEKMAASVERLKHTNECMKEMLTVYENARSKSIESEQVTQ